MPKTFRTHFLWNTGLPDTPPQAFSYRPLAKRELFCETVSNPIQGSHRTSIHISPFILQRSLLVRQSVKTGCFPYLRHFPVTSAHHPIQHTPPQLSEPAGVSKAPNQIRADGIMGAGEHSSQKMLPQPDCCRSAGKLVPYSVPPVFFFTLSSVH